MTGSGTVKNKGRIIEGGNSDEDETNENSDSGEGEQGEHYDNDNEDDESFIEIDTEEVFELLAKGKSYATYEGTHCRHCTYCTNYTQMLCLLFIIFNRASFKTSMSLSLYCCGWVVYVLFYEIHFSSHLHAL